MAVALDVGGEASSCRRLGSGFRCWRSILACSLGQSSEVVDCGTCSLGILKREAGQQLQMRELVQGVEEEGDSVEVRA